MTATTANTSLVWLVNSDDTSTGDKSRNLIRSNAAAFGHRTRRQKNRAHVCSKPRLAPDLHLNVHEPVVWV